ncbi:MAG: hypothetical protein JNK82_07010 [Myxococcaceae bacterium]|nr:hypothetical protein [Myxococcaceae bacterium]
MGKRLRYWIALVLLPVQGAWAAPCTPDCRSGFMCVQGRCVSRCNPPCAAGEACTDQGECVSKNADFSPPPPPPPVNTGPTGNELPPPPPPPGMDGSPPPPPVPGPGYGYGQAPPYRPENPRLLELKSQLHEARQAPSLASGIVLLSLGTTFLIASLAFWAAGTNTFNTSRFDPCSTRNADVLYCVAGFGTGVAGLIITPLGIVRFVRALTMRSRIPEIEAEMQSLGFEVPEER